MALSRYLAIALLAIIALPFLQAGEGYLDAVISANKTIFRPGEGGVLSIDLENKGSHDVNSVKIFLSSQDSLVELAENSFVSPSISRGENSSAGKVPFRVSDSVPGDGMQKTIISIRIDYSYAGKLFRKNIDGYFFISTDNVDALYAERTSGLKKDFYDINLHLGEAELLLSSKSGKDYSPEDVEKILSDISFAKKTVSIAEEELSSGIMDDDVFAELGENKTMLLRLLPTILLNIKSMQQEKNSDAINAEAIKAEENKAGEHGAEAGKKSGSEALEIKKPLLEFTQDTCPTCSGTVHILSNTIKKESGITSQAGKSEDGFAVSKEPQSPSTGLAVMGKISPKISGILGHLALSAIFGSFAIITANKFRTQKRAKPHSIKDLKSW